MRTELLIIVISIITVFSLVWIYFYIRAIEKQRNEKYLAKKQKDKSKYFQELKEEKNKQKKVTYYKLNTHPIKLNLYSKSYFKNYNMEELYRKVIIKNYWLDEPFHSEFSKILQLIGSNTLWIKDPQSREIVMNIRDNTDNIRQQVSMNVLDLSEVINDLISEIYLILKNKILFNKNDIQNAILCASIYVLSMSGEIDYICKSLGIKYLDKDDLRNELIDEIYKNLSQESKQIIAQNHFVNSSNFKNIYDKIIFNAYKHPYTYSVDTPKLPTIKLLAYMPKKKLLSIS